MAETTTAVVRPNDYGTQVIQRMDDLCKVGFTVPQNYNYINAIKASMLVLSDLKDRSGRLALETCSPASIQKALFKMATRGLDASKNQCYFVVKGGQLCCDESYFGMVAQVKRVFPDWEPYPRVVYEGDDFAFGVDPKTSKRYLIRHEQTLANLDNEFVGAYLYLPSKDGVPDLYVMTRKEVLTAWSKSPSAQHLTHKQFPAKMIGKTIVKSGCTMIINSTPELQTSQFDGDDEDEVMTETAVTNVPTHQVTEVNVEAMPIEVIEETKPKAETEILDEDF